MNERHQVCKMDSKTLKVMLHDFSQTTSLHGYNYFTFNNIRSKYLKLTWAFVIFIFSALGIGLLVVNTKQYLSAGLQTNIESSTKPLHVSYDFKQN